MVRKDIYGSGKSISRRRFIQGSAFSMAAFGLGRGRLTAAAQDAGRPNIIFFMTDDQGYHDVGYMGHPHLKTPVLDEMAEHGLRLDRFYSASPVCSPTRASVLSGRHPNRSGTFRHGHQLRPEERSVATLLRNAGYRTGFFGKWHIGSVQAGRPTSPGAHGFDTWSAAPNYYVNNPWLSRNGKAVRLHGESSMVTVEEALPFIEDAAKSKTPFLAFIWTGSPHSPHIATEELLALYAGQPRNEANYYGEITGIDRALGRLREHLRKTGIHENTILWFTSDNGGDRLANNGPLRGGKATLWEGGIRVPTVVEWPARIRQRISHFPAGTVDLFPTFLDLAGVNVPDDRPLDGISIAPLIRGNDMGPRQKPLGFWHYNTPGHLVYSDRILEELHELQQAGKEEGVLVNEGIYHAPGRDYAEAERRPGPGAWLDGNWKFHRTDSGNFLFNLAEDPGEKNDIISKHPERAKRMQNELRKWEDSVIRSLRGADY
jgi:hypothetical protein